MVSQATEVHKCVRAVPFHGHDTKVSTEITSVTPADG